MRGGGRRNGVCVWGRAAKMNQAEYKNSWHQETDLCFCELRYRLVGMSSTMSYNFGAGWTEAAITLIQHTLYWYIWQHQLSCHQGCFYCCLNAMLGSYAILLCSATPTLNSLDTTTETCLWSQSGKLWDLRSGCDSDSFWLLILLSTKNSIISAV